MSKGKTIRPCYFCHEPVNFILWVEETNKRQKSIFHWANPDGSHHEHATSRSDEDSKNKNHLREIMNVKVKQT